MQIWADKYSCAQNYSTPLAFPYEFYRNKSCNIDCCVNSMLLINQNMIVSQGLELILSIFRRTTTSRSYRILIDRKHTVNITLNLAWLVYYKSQWENVSGLNNFEHNCIPFYGNKDQEPTKKLIQLSSHQRVYLWPHQWTLKQGSWYSPDNVASLSVRNDVEPDSDLKWPDMLFWGGSMASKISNLL